MPAGSYLPIPIMRRYSNKGDCPCVVVVRVPGYRSRGLGLIPGTNRFSEK
jgi:hypothetical protein